MGSNRGWLVPLTGVAGVVLLIVSFVVQGEPPDLGDEPARVIADHYVDNKDQAMLGAGLQALSMTLFVFFFAHVSRLIRVAEGDRGMLSRVAFGGGLIFAVAGAFDATLVFAMAETAEDVRPESIVTLLALYENDFAPLAVGLQVFLLGVGLASWRLRVLPKWLAGIALLMGVVAVTPIGFVAFLGMALWIPVTAILLAVRLRREGDPGARMSGSARSDI